MTSENYILDIHICGACRSEFSDICKFIQHKKECYLSVARGHGHMPDLSHLSGQCAQHLHSSDSLELHLPNNEFHPEVYPYSAAHAADNLENVDSSQTSVQISASSVLTGTEHSMPDCARKEHEDFSVSSGLTGTEHSMPDCARKEHEHFSYALSSPMVSEHKNLDVATLYSWSAEPDIKDETVSTTLEHNIAENDLNLVADTLSHLKDSINVDNSTEESRNHVDISADNIAVYVMSPKSFVSSVKTQSKCNHNLRSKSYSEYNTTSVWLQSQSEQQNHMLDVFTSVITSPSSKRSYINFDGGEEQQNDLMYIHQDNAGSEHQKRGTSSGFYCDSDVAIGSNNSTPCPEDLEVGQISATMFGKKNRQEDFKIVLNVSTASESVQNQCKTSVLNSTSVISQSDSYYKILVDDIDSIQGCARDNTANATLFKVKKEFDVQGQRRISVEKRERLQGVSDDLLSTPVKWTKPNNAGSQKTVTQVTIGNTTNAQLSHTSAAEVSTVKAPTLMSYKAIFTSPSSGGHRLTTTRTGLSEPVHCSIQGFSSLKKQLFNRGSGNLVSKTIEYKNISASAQNQNKQSGGHIPETDSSSLLEGDNKSGSQINSKTRDSFSREPNNHELNTHHDLTLSAILGHSTYISQTGTETPDKSQTAQSSTLTSSLNTSLTNFTKTQAPTASENKLEDLQLNAGLNAELNTAENGSNHLEEDVPVLIMGNLSSAPTYIEEGTNNNCHINTNSGTTIELPFMTHNDDSKEVNSTTYPNNTSIVMIYKNSEGSVIMIPKMFYSTALQNNSHSAEEFQTERGDTNKEELLFKNESQNFEQNQQQKTEFGIHLDVKNANDNLPGPSQHYYIQNLGTSCLNQIPVVSSIESNTVLTNTGVSYFVSQPTNITPNTVHIKMPMHKGTQIQKPPDFSSKLNGPGSLEKERYIIKPKKGETASKSSSVVVDQSYKDVKRALQISPQKSFILKDVIILSDLLVCDVSVREDDKKTRSFTCKFDKCRYTTNLYKDFQRHSRRHTGEKPYQCMDCGRTFNRSDKLKLHQRRHSGLKPFQCQLCDYAAIEGGSLKKHMRIHTDERPFKCQICTYASRNSSQLIVHLRTHTGDSPFHCTKCAAKFKINSDLKRHMRIHTGEKPFQCGKCDYKSSNKGNLKTHMRINHLEENEIHCPICEFVTSSKKRLREHEKTHNVQVIKCSQCDYTCANLGQLRSHIIIHNSLKPYRCNFCSYSSKQSGNLKKHIQNIHLYKMQGKSKISVSDSENTVKLQSTRRENVLLPIAERSNIHKRSISASCRKLHTCEQCGSSFVREDSLRCHMKQHNSSAEEGKKNKQQSGFEKMECSETANTPSPAFYGHQGIHQIVAAASQIYEENYGLVNAKSKSSVVNVNEVVSNGMTDSSVRLSLTNSQSHADGSSISTSENETRLKETALLQVPWEHRSYTLSVSSDYEESHPCNNHEGGQSFSSVQTKPETYLLKSKSLPNNCSKIHHKQPSLEDNSFRSPKRQVSKQHSPHLLKSRRVEKSFSSRSKQPPAKLYRAADQSTYENHPQLQETDKPGFVQHMTVSSDSIKEPSGAESTVFLTQQGTQNLHHLSLGTMHIQLEPTSNIQIVMPGTTLPKSGQLVSRPINPVVPQQQILLQVQGSSDVPQVFTIPTGRLNTGQVFTSMLSHCMPAQNGQVNKQASSNADFKPASHMSTLMQSSNQIDQPIKHLGQTNNQLNQPRPTC